MLLSVPILPDGTLDDECTRILSEIKAFIDISGEGIYGTRPWKTFGEGVVSEYESKCHNEKPIDAQEGEYRFTSSKDGNVVYCFLLKWPNNQEVTIRSFEGERPIQSVQLLGHGEVTFSQDDTGLRVSLPENAPNPHATALKGVF